MGEAGTEAVMPLARGPDGRLGVSAAGAGARPVQVTVNIATPDADCVVPSGRWSRHVDLDGGGPSRRAVTITSSARRSFRPKAPPAAGSP